MEKKEEFRFTRESEWRTHDGRKIPIKDLDDSHVLNLLNYMERSVNKSRKQIEKLDEDTNGEYPFSKIRFIQNLLDKNLVKLNVINEEIELRNLDRSKSDGGHGLPFKKNGVWVEWKKGFSRPTPIPASIDFINPIEDRVKNLKRESNG